MAQYRVLAKSFINNSLVEEGAVVEYDGIPGTNLEPLDAAAKKAAASVKTKGGKAKAAPAVEAPVGETPSESEGGPELA